MKLSDLTRGDLIIADSGFNCLYDNEICQVHQKKSIGAPEDEEESFFIRCNDGEHFLMGQIDEDNNNHLIGLSPISLQNKKTVSSPTYWLTILTASIGTIEQK